MKAAVCYEPGGPEVLRYEDVPDPEVPPRNVLVRVEAVSIEGGDTLNRAGGAFPSTPHVVGYQCGGTVVAAGEAVAERAVGDRVVATMAHGSHAELVSVPAAATWPVPDGADMTAIACVPIAFGTADDCLFEFGRLRAGETVLVQAGAGGVGLAAVQLAKRAGATVIATASSVDRAGRLLDHGADHAVDYGRDGWWDEIRSLTEGRGADLVVDPVGGRILHGSLRCLAYRGRLITVGQAGRDPEPLDVSRLMYGNHTITGVFLGAEMSTPRVRGMIAGHIADVAAGQLESVVDRTFPLSEAAAAHAYIESRQAFGRVVLVP